MSPTECFKNHDFPFRRGKNTRKGKKKVKWMWSSSSTPPAPLHQQLAHPGAPRSGATATTASESPLSAETKTLWWWAASVCGVRMWMSTAQEAPPASTPGSSRRGGPAPGPGGPQASSAVSEQPSYIV